MVNRPIILTQSGVNYSFESVTGFLPYHYSRLYKGDKIDNLTVWICGEHYDFLKLLSLWNNNYSEWKYVEVV